MNRFIIGACLAGPAVVHAGKLTLDTGGVLATLTAEISVSQGAVAKPVSLAPDVAVGVTPELTLAVVTSTFGTTGFRGGTGDGVCVTGASNGCAHAFNNAGAEALYSLADGIAGVVGVYSLNIDSSFVDLKFGAKTKFTSGAVSFVFNPSLYVGMNHRPTNADQLYLPVGLSYKLATPFSVGVGSGIKGPLGGFTQFGNSYVIPLGFNAVVTPNKAASFGASFTFAKLTGGPALAPNATGSEFRGVHVWLSVAH